MIHFPTPFELSSDDRENLPEAQTPAEPQTFEVLRGEASGRDFIDDALALLATVNFMLTGHETITCEQVAGIQTGKADMACFQSLMTQFSREIAEHKNTKP